MAAYPDDTIAAIATPPGVGAVAIVRLSGREAVAIARRVLRQRRHDRPLELRPSHRARLARLRHPDDGRAIDQVLALPMLAPASFTGEDVVEIHCHGGRLAADLALRAVLAAGARGARPGEFTERAFLNGRLDLCQAEAVADLVEATSEAGLAAARAQLEGRLSAEIAAAREVLLDARALVDAHLDFPEEDLPAEAEREIGEAIRAASARVERLAATYGRGRLARDGARVVLAGKPNVGKSSLLNALLGRERALVSPVPGTTRDYLEEPLALGRWRVLLVDTAGQRSEGDALERAGVARARESLEAADLALVLLDGSRPLDREDRDVLERTRGRPRLVVRSKADLEPAWTGDGNDLDRGPGSGGRAAPRGSAAAGDSPASEIAGTERPIPVSARTGQGLERLCRALADALGAAEVEAPAGAGRLEEEVLVTRARHHEALLAAGRSLGAARDALASGGPLDAVSCELQAACSELDALLGATTAEDVLDRIFRRFCVGK